MQTIDSLAGDLARVHWRLGDRVTWRRILERAREGSSSHLAMLGATALASEALALISRVRGHEHDAPASDLRGAFATRATAMRSATALLEAES